MPPTLFEKRGRLQFLKDREYQLRVSLHNVAMGIIDAFAPVDYRAFKYLDNVNTKILTTNVDDFKKRHEEFLQLLADIRDLQAEIDNP